MKILHIAPIGDLKQGIGSVIESLSYYQRIIGNELKIVSPRKNNAYPDMDVIHIEKSKEFNTLINTWKPDIVHFHSVYWKQYLSFYKILKKRGVPYIVQMHGALSEANYSKNKLKKFIANTLFFNSYLRNAKGLVFLSENELIRCVAKDLCKSWYIIPNGCNVPVLEVRKHNKDHKFLDVIYIGRIEYQVKGLQPLVDAIKFISERNLKNIRFSFYGNPLDPDVDKLKKDLSQCNNIAGYYGGIYGEEKDKRFRDADLFILTSPSEGLPMGVLEALSYGIPCILTPGTNMAEIVENVQAGWKTELDTNCIVETIRKADAEISDNSERYRNNAIELAKKYDWSLIAQTSIEIYRKVICQH
ncbi:MAG: glycosyltransferase [Paludibacteraceae bacterium]|nr:glycosyltransferase [Paludibacteraceae bacterium]